MTRVKSLEDVTSRKHKVSAVAGKRILKVCVNAVTNWENSDRYRRATFHLLMTDPLFDAVDTLSGLLKRLRELRKYTQAAVEIAEVSKLIDETALQIMRVLKASRGTKSKATRRSVDQSSATRKWVGGKGVI